MKRLIVGIVILVLIISSGIGGIIYTDRLVAELSHSLNLADKSVHEGEFKAAKAICEQAKEDFESKEKLLSLFLNHSLIEEIEETLSLLPELAAEDSKNSLLSYIEKLQTNLLELKESQKHIF